MGYYDDELMHYGVKGMKWGVRRYKNKDGSLTSVGKKKYRKTYDDVRQQQVLSERAGTINSTHISAFDKYNSRYYEKNGKNKLKLLTKKIGNKGLSQLDEDVINEGRVIAEEAAKQTEYINKKYNIDENSPFWTDPKRIYDLRYNKYVDSNLVKR